MLRVRTNASHDWPLLLRNFYNKKFRRFEVLRLETSDNRQAWRWASQAQSEPFEFQLLSGV